MDARRTTALVILAAFLGLAVLSVLGNPILGGIFIVVAGAVLARQAFSLCPRCSNMACAFNPRFSVKSTGESEPAGDEGYSCLPITQTTVIPLLIAGPLAFIGAWQFSPVGAIVVGVAALAGHTVFQRITCSQCGNDCAGNCNPQYRQWKAAQKGMER